MNKQGVLTAVQESLDLFWGSRNTKLLSVEFLGNSKLKGYRIQVYEDLLGDLVISRFNFACDSRLGQRRTATVISYESIQEQLFAICATRIKRGYTLSAVEIR